MFLPKLFTTLDLKSQRYIETRIAAIETRWRCKLSDAIALDMQPDADPKNWGCTMLDLLYQLSLRTPGNLHHAQALLRAEFRGRREGRVARPPRYKNMDYLTTSDVLRAIEASGPGDYSDPYEEQGGSPEALHLPTTRARAAAINIDDQRATGGLAAASEAQPLIASPAETVNVLRQRPIQHGPRLPKSASRTARNGTVTLSSIDREIMDLEDKLARRRTEEARCEREEAELMLAHARKRKGWKRARTSATSEVVDLGSEPDDELEIEIETDRKVIIEY